MSENYFTKYDWNTMMSLHGEIDFSIPTYHEVLCPKSDFPDFLNRYIELPVLQRLKGVGLLCGTDWTKLYHNRIYYSRLDHSIGVALIIWHFTHNKAQTIAGLLHDISTPTFSHVSDFRKGDALTQTVTEGPTATIIRNDSELQKLLKYDNLTNEEIEDYHIYPIADNEIPQLSADRLEYMFPSGAALDGSWTMEEIARCYNDILILKNEQGMPELGFSHVKIAEEYCRHFCMIGHILQLNENKLTLHMLGQIMNMAVESGVLNEEDFMQLNESQILNKIEKNAPNTSIFLTRYFNTFRKMTEIEHTNEPLSSDEYFCVNLKVKQRYINPLVQTDGNTVRLSDISQFSKNLIKDFLSFEDTKFGCVKLLNY